MSLHSIDEKNLVQMINLTKQTLERVKTRTLELKQRNNRTLEETEKHAVERRNKQRSSERFSDSISFTPNYKSAATAAIPRRQSCSSLHIQPLKQEIQSKSELNHGLQNVTPKSRILPGPKSPQKQRLDSCEIDKKKNGFNKQKVKTILFRTLDGLLRLNNTTSHRNHGGAYQNNSPNFTKPLGLDTLRKLNENVPDTLPRKTRSDENTSTKCITKNAQKSKNASHVQTTSTQIPHAEISNHDDENAWNSSDNESWMYIPTPLKYEEVVIESSLEYTKTEKKSCNTNRAEMPKDSRQFLKNRNSKKQSGKENKIQKRIVDRHITKQERKNSKNLHPVKIPRAKICRPDSPLQKVKQPLKPLQAVSLPNLMEELSDTLSLSSDFDTNSFLREIALRPSSTLSKSVPCISDIVECENDDYSVSSSFSSFQNTECETKASHPSALCSAVDVMPIDVPIAPWNIRNHEIRDMHIVNVKKVMKRLEYADESSEQTLVHPSFLKQHSLIQEIVIKDEATTTINHNQEPAHEISSSVVTPSDINVVLNEFSWLETPENDSENTKDVEAVPTNDSLISKISGSVEAKPPSYAPPPPPPPMEGKNQTGSYRALRNLPLPVFTQPQSINTVFTNLESIPIKDNAMKRLKENYSPKKSHAKSIAAKLLSFGKGRTNPATANYKLNMEIFLKTWDIMNLEEFLEAVRTLQVDSLNSCIQHIKNDSSDTGCISSLIQVVSKLDVTEQFLKIKKPKLDKTDNLISGLVSIPRLKEKLECIQFSMDFKELFDCIYKRIESFIEACASVNTSEKFLDIIKLVMTLLNCLNSGGSKIYGFDIRGLCKLATNTFNDGTTTLLHFLIEYVSNEPSLKDSLDFYMDFQHLSEVAKTSIKDMEEQCLILKANETAYKKELELIKKEYEADHKHSNEMATATVFQKNLENAAQSLFTQLGVAKDVFNSCKERYGLTNSDITEVEFFKSLSDFIMAYQKIYAEINEQRNRESQKKPALSARLSEPSKNARSKLPKPKRKSVGAARVSQNVNPEERTNSPNDLEDGLLKFLEHDGGGKRRDRKAKKF